MVERHNVGLDRRPGKNPTEQTKDNRLQEIKHRRRIVARSIIRSSPNTRMRYLVGTGVKPRRRNVNPPATKQEAIIDLLKRPKGASIADLMNATGWQAHSVRGAISGSLKKKLGLAVTSEPVEDRGRVYRISNNGYDR